jgi:hypothetical protein
VTPAKGLSDKKILRYWVEVRELATSSVRKLPLTAVMLVCLKTGKKDESPLPDREVLRLKDDEETWEASDFDELKIRLRDRYPDAAFERTLHTMRDHEAEERRDSALHGLISLLAKSVVDEFVAEQSRDNAKPGAPQT